MSKMEHHGEINSSQHEYNENVNRVDSSSSPTTSKTSCHDEVHKGSSEVKQLSPSTSDHNMDSSTLKQGEEIESTKAEMGEVMEENQRLKKSLDQIMNDYEALQKKFREISQQKSKEKQIVDDHEVEAELVSLSLGRTSSLDSKKIVSTMSKHEIGKRNDVDEEEKDGSLALTLDSKFEASRSSNSSPGNSSGDQAKGRDCGGGGGSGGGALWPPSKAQKSGDRSNGNGEDEMVQQQPPVKKARVSVRARCDTPTMNDGCQWRKYGQKIAKGNPCPRAYYRCTVAPSCPVRKQVQRCVEDMSILITTYEGAHNHPLPVSATAMASTTSATAYMLVSGSSTSPNQGSQVSTTTTPTSPFKTELHDNRSFNVPTRPQPYYLSASSSAFSNAPIHPTITLDLTSPTSSSTNQVNKMPPNIASNYSSTHSLDNFNNSFSFLPNGLLNYGDQSYLNKTQVRPLNNVPPNHSTSNQDHTLNFHSLFQMGNHTTSHPNQDPLPDSIAQAAKLLTSDPNFQSVLTAALSSFMNGNNEDATTNAGIGKTSKIYDGRVNTINSMDFENKTPSSSSKTFEPPSKGCTSSLFLSPLPFPKSSSSSPSDI